ncbi:hypothetical protein [Thermococcus stetteri]|uniref:hypothetical protein n=1 Tax=Thermococcus stetteri TaxID=49900 RepID=UPI001FD7C1D4|nr:hypothetical protein [Thermococcus stetteri]MBP1911074.1 cytoskeletal protein RodZ [Thermococcus stetteri]
MRSTAILSLLLVGIVMVSGCIGGTSETKTSSQSSSPTSALSTSTTTQPPTETTGQQTSTSTVQTTQPSETATQSTTTTTAPPSETQVPGEWKADGIISENEYSHELSLAGGKLVIY